MQLESFFPYRLAVTAERFSRNLSEVYGHTYGLSREEWRLLYLLSGAVSVTSLDLTRRTTLDKVQVSRAAQRLEAKGLITRAVPKKDRRLRVYACTDKGRALFTEILPQLDARTNDILSAMPPEDRAALATGLSALAHALDARSRDRVAPV